MAQKEDLKHAENIKKVLKLYSDLKRIIYKISNHNEDVRYLNISFRAYLTGIFHLRYKQ